jgi:hypothetical protein
MDSRAIDSAGGALLDAKCPAFRIVHVGGCADLFDQRRRHRSTAGKWGYTLRSFHIAVKVRCSSVTGKIFIFVIVAVLSDCVYAGDIFRCVSANGDVMYTNMACPPDSQIQHVASYTPVPDAPVAPYSVPGNADNMALASRRNAAIAYQSQLAYEQLLDDQESEPAPGDDYADGWLPYYGVGPRFQHRHRPPHSKVARSAPRPVPPQRAMTSSRR